MAKRKSAKGKINDLQRKHYTESYRMSNTNPTKTVEGVGGGELTCSVRVPVTTPLVTPVVLLITSTNII
jgi:hypothetical protein